MSSPIVNQVLTLTADSNMVASETTSKFHGLYLDWIHVQLPSSDAPGDSSVLKLIDDETDIEIFTATNPPTGLLFPRHNSTSPAGITGTNAAGFVNTWQAEEGIRLELSGASAEGDNLTITVRRTSGDSRRDVR